MNKLIGNTNLNVNSWLINWGLMPGYLRNQIIETTKFGLFNQWFCFLLSLFTAIKWIILMFYSADSQMANLLGETAKFYGPKLIVDVIIVIVSCHSAILTCLFYFCTKSSKILFWLDFMEYDSTNQCFNKLNLNETYSKIYIKRFAFISSITFTIYYLNCFLFYTFGLIIIYLSQKDYLSNYIISITIYSIGLYYFSSHLFGPLMLLYQVSFGFLSF